MTRQKRMPVTCSPAELLLLVGDDLAFLQETYPDLDIALEAHHCCAWYEKGLVRWKPTFYAWLKREEGYRQRQVQRNGHKELALDPKEYAKRYPIELDRA